MIGLKSVYGKAAIISFVIVFAVLSIRSTVAVSPTSSERVKEVRKKKTVLVAVGDVMLSRMVAQRMRAHGPDYPFSKVKDILLSADITFGNLETPIVEGRTIVKNEMTFRADTTAGGALARAGFDIVSLANNHTTNFGPEGLLSTFQNLSKASVAYVGAGKNREEAYAPTYIEKNGTTFAFLAYTYAPDTYGFGSSPNLPGIAGMNIVRMREAVLSAKETADVVVVSIHAGDEYVFSPNDTQKEFARAAIDAGASLVIGHHPHVLQPMERYHDGVILYSLGNFVFDQITRETQEGVITEVTFEEGMITDISHTPVLIEDLCRPRILVGEDAETVLNRLRE
ncbi:MAG: CapA family protein [Candidatus Yonathbacteria bacterium]|nr:CapA family protein [Candidatus Yonathbacteria bacterium]